MSARAPRNPIPLQLKLTGLLVLIVLLPLGVAVYFVGEISQAASNVATGEATARLPVLQRSRRAYEQMIDATKRLHTEVGGRLAKRPDLLALDPALPTTPMLLAFGLEPDAVLARVLAEPSQAGMVALTMLRGDGTVFAEATRPLTGPEWRGKVVDEALADSATTLRLTFEVSATVNTDLEDLQQAIKRSQFFIEVNVSAVPVGYRTAFLVLVALAALGAIGIGVWMSTFVTRKIGALVATARRVSGGNTDARVALHGHDEMTELADAFNAMLDDLEASRGQVEYLQRVGVWQDVARRLAHEIKNPLTPIQLAVQQCVSAYRGDDARYAKLLADTGEIVEEEIQGLRRLVDTFRTLGALPRVEAAPVELAELIEELRLDPTMATHLTLVPPPAPVTLRADKLLLKRVLANLVENGIHAGLDAKASGEVVVTWRSAGDQVTITVDDHGPGVAAGDRERIFEPYVTTKATGTGLGLAIAKKIVIEHRGELAVAAERAPTGGARFAITLPL
jgi:two-component system, NtrC family, nitrogen regulation sensor histidine kinase NtrY